MKFKNFLLIFFLISLILPNYVKSDECKNFEDKVLEIPYPEDGLVTDGQQPRNNLGIYFHKTYDYEKNKIVIKRNQDGYPIVKISLLQKNIKPLSLITSINGANLSKVGDSNIYDLVAKKTSNLETSDGNYTIKAKEYDLYPFDLEFFSIRAIDEIKTKEGEFQLDYSFQVTHERPDWIVAGREIGNLTICPIDELTEKSQIYSPVTNQTSFLEQIGYDQDKTFSSYEQIYFEEFDKTVTQSSHEGVARIKVDFDLKRFPFDEQVLKIKLYPPYGIEKNEQNNYPKAYVSTFTSRNNVYLDLKRYKNDNFLKEWTITDYKVENEIEIEDTVSPFDRDKLTQSIFDVIILKIKVKRNINYFIFKIIIPVFLILSIVWSVMWIPPNQVESRLTTSIVGLLSLIAYNFVFNDDLPKLSYLTSLDRYVLLSYLFCAIPTFLTVYFSRLTKKDYQIALAVNKKSRIVGIVIYIISTYVIFS
jgi:hypothetical protein